MNTEYRLVVLHCSLKMSKAKTIEGQVEDSEFTLGPTAIQGLRRFMTGLGY